MDNSRSSFFGNNNFANKELQEAIKAKNAQNLVDKLSNEDREKLNNVLNDRAQLESLLKSEQAQQIMKMLGWGKQDG